MGQIKESELAGLKNRPQLLVGQILEWPQYWKYPEWIRAEKSEDRKFLFFLFLQQKFLGIYSINYL